MTNPESDDRTAWRSRIDGPETPPPPDTPDATPAAGAGDPASPPPDQRPVSPHQLGRYRVLAVLGRGGMGVVYRAEDPLLRRAVALKVMHPRFVTDPDARARFLREARAQAAIEHDHVVPIYDVVEADGTACIAMPLLRGMTLAAALAANPRPPVRVLVRVAREIAEGLAAAHETGLIHRDIKPGNVWLEERTLRVRILDFGLARLSSADGGASGALTTEGAIVGTPSYMSPEQARGLTVDARTDLFSLGVVLYQMATGRRPFNGPTAPAVLMATITEEPPAPGDLVEDLPPALGALVMRLLAKDPAGRPPAAAGVAEELRAIEYGLAAVPVQVVELGSVPGPQAGGNPWDDLDATEPVTVAESRPPGPPARPRRPRGSGLWVAAGVLGLALVVALSWAAYRALTRKDPPPVEAEVSRPAPQPVPAPKAQPVVDHERLSAEELLPFVRDLHLELASRARVVVKAGESLPAEPFAVVAVTWPAPDQLRFDSVLAERTLVPAVARLQRVERLNDSFGWFRLSDADLARLAASPAVGALHALGTPDLNPQTVAALKQFPKLTSLVLRHDGTGDQWPALKNLPPNIVQLQLEGIGYKAAPGEAGLAALSSLRVQHLYFHWVKTFDRRIAKAVAAMPELNHIGVSGTLEPGAVAELTASRSLRRVSLNASSAADADLEHLQRMARLRSLNVRESKVTEAGVKRLAAALPRCKVEWDGGTIEPSDAHYREADRMLGRRMVVKVQLAGGKTVTANTPAELPDEQFTLTAVSRSGLGTFADEDLKRMVELGTLQELSVEGNPLTDAGLAPLKDSAASLTALLVGASGLTDGGMKHIAPLKNLRGLSVGRTKVTDAGLAGLAGLTKIGYLALIELDVTDAGLRHLAGISELRILSLRETLVTDAGLETLAGLKALTQVDLSGTRVTEAGVKRLRASLPACKVEWEEPNRAVAARLAGKPGYRVRVALPDGSEVTPTGPDKLPAGPFTVVSVEVESPTQFGDDEFRQIRSLTGVRYLALTTPPGLTERGYAVLPVWKDTLKALYLSRPATAGLDDAALAHVGKLSGLNSFNLGNAPLTDAGLKHLSGLNLIDLSLTETAISDAGVETLAAMKGLRQLNLKRTRITAAGLKKLQAALPACKIQWEAYDPDREAATWVRSVNGRVTIRQGGKDKLVTASDQLPDGAWELTGVDFYRTNSVLSDAALSNLRNCRNLEYLNLSETKISDAGLVHFKDCRELRWLNLCTTQIGDAGMAHFKDCKKLSRLELAQTKVGDAGLAHFGACKHLTNLALGDTQVTDAGLAHFRDCKALVGLALSRTRVSDAGLAYFKDCKNLAVLSLGNTKLTDAGMAHVKDSTELVILQLDDTGVTDAGLANFRNCKKLITVNLSGTAIGDAGLAHLKDCKRLNWIALSRTKVTDAGLVHLRDCNKLTYLNVSESQVGDAGVAHLKGCTDLTELWLNGTKITDQALTHIQGCKKLGRLFLAGTGVGDAGLELCRSFTDLTELTLQKTKVTEPAVRRLAAALPGCRIAWDGGTIGPKEK